MSWSGNVPLYILAACFALYGLIQLILLNNIQGRLKELVQARQQPVAVPVMAQAPVPVVAAATAAAPAPSDHGMLIAAISAAIAEELGTDLSKIRIHSFKQV